MLKPRAGALALLLCWPALGTATLRFVGSDFPAISQSGTDQYYGLGIEVIKRLCQQEKLHCQVTLLPWPRAQAMVQNGQAEVLIGPYRTQERTRFLQFSRYPLYVDTLYWYRHQQQSWQWNGDFASLQQLRLGITNGWTLGQAYENARPRLNVDNANTLEQNMLKLLRQRLDLVASNERNARYTLGLLGSSQQIVALQPAIGQQGGYLGYALTASKLPAVQRFEHAFRHLADSGELARLSQQYGLAYPAKPPANLP